MTALREREWRGAGLTIHDSEVAMASDATFTLRVNTNGHNKESEGQLSLLWNKNL